MPHNAGNPLSEDLDFKNVPRKDSSEAPLKGITFSGPCFEPLTVKSCILPLAVCCLMLIYMRRVVILLVERKAFFGLTRILCTGQLINSNELFS